ncbi:MAG: TonB-dependent siderophore receptor [Pseudomonadota bacterium]
MTTNAHSAALSAFAIAGSALAATSAGAQSTGVELDEIVVEGEMLDTPAGPVDGWRAFTADSTTRTRTPIEEIPQSIQVIPRQVIDDQQADTVSDVVRNVSGVQGIQRRERTQQLDGNFLIRGQFTEAYVNGRVSFFDQGLDPESTINLERVEVIKGTSSGLFTAANGAPISGVINLVEKTPLRDARYSLEGSAGMFDFYNVAFDVNQPLIENGDLAFRVTGDYRTSNDFVDQADDETVGIFPTLRYDNGTTAVTLRGRYQYSQFNFYNGLPTLGDEVPAPGFSARDAVAAFDQPDTVLEAYSFDILAEHEFGSGVTARFRSGYQDADGEQNTTLSGINLFGAGAPGDIVRTDNTQLLQVNTFDVGGEVVWEADLADNWEHTLLVGAEYQSTDTNGVSFFNFGPASQDLSVIQSVPFDSGSFASPFGLNLDTVTGIFQSQSTFYDRFHFLAALSVSGTNIQTIGVPDITDTILSPRVGLAVDIGAGFTPFVGWGRGFRTPQGVAASFSFFTIEEVAIERNEQVEVGLRFNRPELGLSGSIAAYNLKRDDAAVLATSAAQVGVLDVADQRSRGVEVDVIWQPAPEWRFLANYAYTDAEIVEGGSPFEGNELQRVPEHSGRIAMRYDALDGVLEGLGVGLGVTALSSQPGDLGNTFFTDGYVTVDAQVSYRRGPVEAAIGIDNLFDSDTFVPNFNFQGNTAPIQPFTVAGRLKVTF